MADCQLIAVATVASSCLMPHQPTTTTPSPPPTSSNDAAAAAKTLTLADYCDFSPAAVAAAAAANTAADFNRRTKTVNFKEEAAELHVLDEGVRVIERIVRLRSPPSLDYCDDDDDDEDDQLPSSITETNDVTCCSSSTHRFNGNDGLLAAVDHGNNKQIINVTNHNNNRQQQQQQRNNSSSVRLQQVVEDDDEEEEEENANQLDELSPVVLAAAAVVHLMNASSSSPSSSTRPPPKFRRCHSEVAASSSSSAVGEMSIDPSITVVSPGGMTEAATGPQQQQQQQQPPAATVQNALTAKDKIQAFARTARELRTLKLHYYTEGGWGWMVLFCAAVTQCVCYGLLLAVGTLMSTVTRRYATAATAHQPQQFLVKPFLSGSSSSGSSSAIASSSSSLDPGILLAHYRPIYLSSAPVNYPTPIAGYVAGALASLSLCIASLLSPVIIAWCRRKSTRLTAVFGGLLAALGLLFTSFASQFHQLFLSYGLVLGIGVGLTRDTATLMVGQYFKRRREAVEIALVGASGVGLAVMTVFLHTTLSAIGWRLGLQSVTGLVLLTFILGSCYRSASLYHPQRRAILHLKNQRKKVKEKNKQEDKPPFFDFSSLKSRTIQTIMVSSASIATGIYTPLIYLGYEAEKIHGRDASMWLQVYMGLSWTLGCATVGLLIVREPAECKIGRQYLCQAAGMLIGLALLSQAVVSSPHHTPPSSSASSILHQQQSNSSQLYPISSNYGLFCWVYGFGIGAYNYALKMFVYQRVRARNFARAWSFVQASQALPLVCGIPLAGFLSSEYGQEVAYYASSAFVITGSLALFIIDIRKYVLTHFYKHKHGHHHHHHRKPKTEGVNGQRTPKVASEPNTDGGGSAIGGASEGIIDGIQIHQEEGDEEEEEECPPSCKGRVRRDSLAEEEVHLPPLTLLQQTSLVLAQLGELPCGAAAAELTCISEEGIADMDIPDHLLEELDFAADCITSCDKVENYLMLSEYENNLIQQHSATTGERKSRKTSLFRQLGQSWNNRYGNRSGGHQHEPSHKSHAKDAHTLHANRRTQEPKMSRIYESNEAENNV